MKQFIASFPTMLKMALITAVMYVLISIIDYVGFPDLKYLILFLDVITMLFVPYFLYKHFQPELQAKKLPIFMFFVLVYFLASCILYGGQTLLHHVFDPNHKEQIALQSQENMQTMNEKIDRKNSDTGITVRNSNVKTPEEAYQVTLANYTVLNLLSKPFRNLPYYLIFSLLATIAVLKFNRNDYDS